MDCYMMFGTYWNKQGEIEKRKLLIEASTSGEAVTTADKFAEQIAKEGHSHVSVLVAGPELSGKPVHKVGFGPMMPGTDLFPA